MKGHLKKRTSSRFKNKMMSEGNFFNIINKINFYRRY